MAVLVGADPVPFSAVAGIAEVGLVSALNNFKASFLSISEIGLAHPSLHP